jgi:hypothetical protein
MGRKPQRTVCVRCGAPPECYHGKGFCKKCFWYEVTKPKRMQQEGGSPSSSPSTSISTKTSHPSSRHSPHLLSSLSRSHAMKKTSPTTQLRCILPATDSTSSSSSSHQKHNLIPSTSPRVNKENFPVTPTRENNIPPSPSRHHRSASLSLPTSSSSSSFSDGFPTTPTKRFSRLNHLCELVISELGTFPPSPQRFQHSQEVAELHSKVMAKMEQEMEENPNSTIKWQERYETMRQKVAKIDAEKDVLDSLKALSIAPSDATKLTKSHLHAFLLRQAKTDKDVRLSGKRQVLLARVRSMLAELEADRLISPSSASSASVPHSSSCSSSSSSSSASSAYRSTTNVTSSAIALMAIAAN